MYSRTQVYENVFGIIWSSASRRWISLKIKFFASWKKFSISGVPINGIQMYEFFLIFNVLERKVASIKHVYATKTVK